MATLKKSDRSPMLPIGARVWSKAIGKRAEFEGIITEHFGASYHVADEDGNGWLRAPHEIKLVEGKVA